MLRAGTQAPEFELVDQKGTVRRLTDLRAGGPVVVFFYPAALSPGCTREACRFRDLWAEFAAAGASVVGVSADEAEKQMRFDQTHHLGYPLLSDAGGSVAAAFGVKRSLRWLPPKRVTFVIRADGRIEAVVKSEVNMNVHVEKSLGALQAANDTK